MDPSTDSHDNAWPLTEELFAIPFAPDILLFLKGKRECTEAELKDEVCNGKSPEKALVFLTGKGLIESMDGCIKLTSKGEKAADVLSKIEELLSNAEQHQRV